MGNNIQKILTTYKVNLRTMIISPKEDSSYGTCSLVKEVDDEFIVLQKPTDIIKHSCISYGVGYDGRVQGTQALTGITHKPPIAINSSNNLFFFPTNAAAHHECIWISHRHVKKVSEAPQNKVKVHFSNHFSDTLNVSTRSFKNQLYRTAQVKSAYLDCEAPQKESKPTEIIYENEMDEYILDKNGTKVFQLRFSMK